MAEAAASGTGPDAYVLDGGACGPPASETPPAEPLKEGLPVMTDLYY